MKPLMDADEALKKLASESVKQVRICGRPCVN